jgi:hypothetical protein
MSLIPLSLDTIPAQRVAFRPSRRPPTAPTVQSSEGLITDIRGTPYGGRPIGAGVAAVGERVVCAYVTLLRTATHWSGAPFASILPDLTTKRLISAPPSVSSMGSIVQWDTCLSLLLNPYAGGSTLFICPSVW